MKTRDITSDMDMLLSGLSRLSLSLEPSQIEQFASYIKDIHLFNATYRLVGAEGRDFVVKHLLDSVAAVPIFRSLVSRFPDQPTICDVGSGAGLPGIPLAIMMPDTSFVLIERSGRRSGFLRNAIAICNLHDRVEVIERDLSEVDRRFPVVTFRAFHPLVDIIRPLDSIVIDGGYVCAYKGRKEAVEEEIAQVRRLSHSETDDNLRTWSFRVERLDVPFLAADRSLCVMQDSTGSKE